MSVTHGATIVVREAVESDTEACVSILRESIRQLCVADHGNDPAAIEAWLANKTVENARQWIVTHGTWFLVAEVGGRVVGVGSVSRGGTVLLNYVVPSHRFMGVSTALLAALEERLVEAGVTVADLSSSLTAQRFYRSRGWVPNASQPDPHEVRMQKNLSKTD